MPSLVPAKPEPSRPELDVEIEAAAGRRTAQRGRPIDFELDARPTVDSNGGLSWSRLQGERPRRDQWSENPYWCNNGPVPTAPRRPAHRTAPRRKNSQSRVPSPFATPSRTRRPPRPDRKKFTANRKGPAPAAAISSRRDPEGGLAPRPKNATTVTPLSVTTPCE